MINGTYTALTGEPKTQEQLFSSWFNKYEYFLLADFRVSVKRGEFSEEEFEKFLSFEWQYHLQELGELAQQAANQAY
jgi:hypothetical protein